MRCAGLLIVTACLALPAAATAQDPFSDVPNEPRSDEYHHWDAEAVAGFQGDLDEALRKAAATPAVRPGRASGSAFPSPR